MDKPYVVFKIFPNLTVAELARWNLENAGIDSYIQKDDAGGMYPFLQQQAGVRLVGHPDDAETAQEILEGLEKDSGQDDVD